MSEGLFGRAELETLIMDDDVLEGAVACLRRLWKAPDALERRELEHLEFRTRLLEQTLHAQYPPLYDDIIARVGKGFSPTDVTSGCCVVADALSLREAFQLERDLAEEEGWEVTFDWSVCPALPTGTEYATRAWFGSHAPSAVTRDDYAYVGGDNIRIPNTNPAYVWMRFPDERLHDAVEGRHVVEPVADVYDHAKQMLVRVVEATTHDSVLVTSDHGYLNFSGRNPYSLPERSKAVFEEEFDGRHCDVVNNDALHELEEQGFTVRSEGHYLVAGHYDWDARETKITHGGMSLLECLIPVLRIDKQPATH